ncbi:MAG TPA: type II secretion system protein [Thermoanaerobaculaceae bacterium]|nr:type II secretion system protein [Thermoanaerobaculaceae bacterium]
MAGNRGFSLMETTVTVGLLALAATVAMPNLFEVRRDVDLHRLARQVFADAANCRLAALTSCRNVGLVFAEQDGRWYYTQVMDGDNDGVSRADFLKGVDKPIGPRIWLEFLSAGTRVGVPVGWHVPDPSGDGYLPENGLRIGNSAIISFSNEGHATPSTVYFNDGQDRMLAIRTNGETGLTRALLWRRGWSAWRPVTL